VAQKIQTLLIDDLDGSEADGTVRFGLDGTEYRQVGSTVPKSASGPRHRPSR
jgi:hypothetical protein